MSLEVLAENRKDLLLAEVAAWLHDMGKCSDEMIEMQAIDRTSTIDFKYKTHFLCLLDSVDTEINLCGEKATIKELIERGVPDNIKETSFPWIIRCLGRCHAAAHIEKEDPLTKEEKNELNKKIKQIDREISQKITGVNKIRQTVSDLEQKGIGNPVQLRERADNMEQEAFILQKEVNSLRKIREQIYQKKDKTMKSTPFGFEKEQVNMLTAKLKSIPFAKIADTTKERAAFLDEVKNAFKCALGDTRHPINEITLYSWSSIAAALYKAALAGALLGNKPEPNNLRWRLLAIRFDSETFLNTSVKIPALLARKKWLSDGLDNLKQLLEETYPLGNEVYRDENGSIFVVPDINDLLKITNSENKTLQELIIESLGYDGEITVTPDLGEAKWGQDPDRRRKPSQDEVFPIAEILSFDNRSYSPPDARQVQAWWDKASTVFQKNYQNNPEPCNVSYIRPQGFDEKKGFRRKISDFWVDKVTGRSKKWVGSRNTTIWLDEVADKNGRICLLSGKLEIIKWLEPGGYLESLFVRPPGKNTSEPVSKTSSFARLRRIWETCQTFWKEVEKDVLNALEKLERVKFQAEFTAIEELNPFTAYIAEDEQNQVRFSIVPDEQGNYYITENPWWLAKKMNPHWEEHIETSKAAEYIRMKLPPELNIYESEGEEREQPLGRLINVRAAIDDVRYLPVISLLAEPSHFMAIVPAVEALKAAQKIKEKYNAEMGKVRNRLPLALGLVFAPSHTPLFALLDAGKRMLNMPLCEENWIIEESRVCGNDHFLRFGNGFEWRVSVKMGDDTDDIWYPYFYLDTAKSGKPVGRERTCEKSGKWLVHVSELKENHDVVKIRPSRLDFEFLDTATRRFEIIYKDKRRRGEANSNRPYYLDELEDFESLWKVLNDNLSQSQILYINSLIETKRAEWRIDNYSTGEKRDVFLQFIADVLKNAAWRNGIPLQLSKLVDAAVSGKLNDIISLKHEILKEKSEIRMKEVL